MAILRLTYEELAERTGRSTEAARALVRRHHWPVEHGNDGKARILVDEREVDARTNGRPPGQHPDAPRRRPDDGHLQVLADELQAVRADRDQVAQERDAARTELETWRRQAEDGRVTSAELRTQVVGKAELVDELRRQRDRLEAQLAEARTPLWARLLAALRARSGS